MNPPDTPTPDPSRKREESVPRVLIIAGSDSGGGAGIQADIKTVTMLGGHAMTAVTAITAQNTLGVTAVHPIPTEMVLAQIDAVLSDLGADAIKIGMIGSAVAADALADRLVNVDMPIVFDPVMVATSGSVLADEDTVAAFTRLMRLAVVVTPNLPELDALGGANAVLAHGCHLLVKGGHAEGAEIVDRLVGPGGEVARWSAPRIDSAHTHGTGCTLASAIATDLGRGASLPEAITTARQFVRTALAAAPGFGGGHGPMGHWAAAGPMNLNQVTLPAHHYAASCAFYAALGLSRVVDAPPRYARFECPGGATLSIHVDPAAVAGDAVTYIEHALLDSWVERLLARGIRFDSLPADQPWRWREARLRDPAGNRLCLYQAGENRRFPPWRVATASTRVG